MMKIFPIAALALATCQSAAAATDFGSIAACAQVEALPKGARIIDGCKSTEVMQACTFSLKKDKHRYHYVIENSRLVNKVFSFNRGGVAPYGIKATDTPATMQKKFAALTGLPAEYFSDDDIQYVQSAEMPCSGNIYRLYAFYKDGKVDEIAVSSLPAI
jgi:hypothetical protein